MARSRIWLGFTALTFSAVAACLDEAQAPGAHCNSNSDCLAYEQCAVGRCHPRADAGSATCAYDEACPAGYYCDVTEATCVPLDGRAAFSTDLGPPVTCSRDDDCQPPSTICVDSTCQFGCGVNLVLCGGDEVCDTTTGRCAMVPGTCGFDEDCRPPDTVCETGQCVPGCGRPGGVQCSSPADWCDRNTGRCVGN